MPHSAKPRQMATGVSDAWRQLRASGRPDAQRLVWFATAALSLLIVGWIVAVFLGDSFRFVVFDPRAKTGFEVFLALGQLFGAVVLVLSSLDPPRVRMRWVALGLLVLGIGALGFGYLVPLVAPHSGPNVSMFGSLLTRGSAAILLAIGLTPKHVPYLGRKRALALLASGGIVTVLLSTIGHRLPQLVETPNWQTMLADGNYRIFPGLTGWYFSLGLVPLAASLVATSGAIRRCRDHDLGVWLIPGSVFFAGAQLHALFWPSMSSSILTTTSVLRFGWTAVIIAGGILELYWLSRERSVLLARERERVHQLEELNVLKRDFTSMVAHELGTPLAAIGNLAQMITTGVLPPAEQEKAAGRILGEARLLQSLVRDIQDEVDVEHDDFSVRPRLVPLRPLMDDACLYAQTMRRNHPLTLDADIDGHVLADPDRIGQVIRNLLNNAVRHTPAGTPISLAAYREGSGVRIVVADRGPGIDQQDRELILGKYSRGTGARRGGKGLGLYLSRGILHAHGTDLTIESEPGEGASFSFRLGEPS